jgi:hypothetical protein
MYLKMGVIVTDGYIKNAININYYDSDFSEQLDFKKVYHLKKGYSSWVNR